MKITFLPGLLLALLMSCSRPPAANPALEFGELPAAGLGKPQYIFAPLPLSNPTKLFEVYEPLVDLINQHAADFTVKLESSLHYADFEKKLVTRRVHLSLVNPYQTVRSEAHGYRIFGKMGDDERFRGLIVVRSDSGIKEVTDLRGATISFPAATAVAACMMPKLFLKQHGLDVERDASPRYVGSQESAVINVVQKLTRAGCIWQQSWDNFQKDQPQLAEQLEVKWQTETLLNNGLIVRDDLPEPHLRAISEILFHLHDDAAGREILARMSLSRFEPAKSETYEPMRNFLNQYETAFGKPPVEPGEL